MSQSSLLAEQNCPHAQQLLCMLASLLYACFTVSLLHVHGSKCSFIYDHAYLYCSVYLSAILLFALLCLQSLIWKALKECRSATVANFYVCIYFQWCPRISTLAMLSHYWILLLSTRLYGVVECRPLPTSKAIPCNVSQNKTKFLELSWSNLDQLQKIFFPPFFVAHATSCDQIIWKLTW